MAVSSRFLVFSDLDGTLLDHATYSFDAAAPALRALAEREIPLVFCTSKTRAETERVREALRNRHPFITENGGAIFMPAGYFPTDDPESRRDGGYLVRALGTSYVELRRALKEMRAGVAPSVRGFGDMSAGEVAEVCGFSLADAEAAKKREYDEPFLAGNENSLEAVRAAAGEAGLRVVTGGRFHHLVGGNDKGRAVRVLSGIFEREVGRATTVGLGDSLNDEPMLKSVDIPVLVRKSDGRHDPAVHVPGLVYARGIGPDGWRDAVLGILESRA
jgi:mannosyl-3-phosphoglycerate phosphatase